MVQDITHISNFSFNIQPWKCSSFFSVYSQKQGIEILEIFNFNYLFYLLKKTKQM
jgi:hypothetical protein